MTAIPGGGSADDAEAHRALAEVLVDSLSPAPDATFTVRGWWLLGALRAGLDPRFRAFVRSGAVAARRYAVVVGTDRSTARAAVDDLRLQLLVLRERPGTPDDPAAAAPVGVGALVAAAEALVGVEVDGDTEDALLARAVRAWDAAADALRAHRLDPGGAAARRAPDALRAHREAWLRWFEARGVDPSR